MANHYQTLGVSRNAPQADIKRAFRARARASHPDHHPHPDAARRFAEIQRAYEVLGNPTRRRNYDLMLDGVRVPRSRPGTTSPRSTPPNGDDRKYGTRHRFTNPPPTKAEQEQRYEEAIIYYSLFTRKGMRLPRREWWKRFDVVVREGTNRKRGGLLTMSIAASLFTAYFFITEGVDILGIFWVLVIFNLSRAAYSSAVRNIAEREMKK